MSEAPCFSWRLVLLDVDQGSVDTLCIVEMRASNSVGGMSPS